MNTGKRMSSCSALFLLQETNMGAVTHFKPSIHLITFASFEA